MSRRTVPLDGIHRNVVEGLPGSPSSAWYVLPPVPWGFVSSGEREHVVTQAAKRLAALEGRRVHWRVTTRPVSIRSWRAQQGEKTRARVPRGADWSARHNRIAEHIDAQGYARKTVFFGVDLQAPTGMLSKFRPHAKDAEEADIARVVEKPGLWGRRAERHELEWLTHRSVRLGHPAIPPAGIVADWSRDDMAEFTSLVREETDPYERWVAIVAPDRNRINGQLLARYVSVVALGRMSIPNLHDPWLALCDSLDFPVEYSITADSLPPKEVIARTERKLRLVRSQRADAVKYKRDLHHSLEAGERTAHDVQVDIESGMSDLAARMDCWAHMAVASNPVGYLTEKELAERDTVERAAYWEEHRRARQEALDRAQQVADVHSPEFSIVGYTSTAYREFTPGERLYGGGSHRHQLGVTTVAGGMPNVASRLGHDSGIYLGWTSSSPADRSPVFWDPHRSMRRNGQGTSVISGVTGAGKSWLGSLMVTEAVQDGAIGFVIDQSGPMASLADLPALRGHAAHWDLLAAPRPGALNPYAIVAQPARAHYDTDIEYDHAVTQAEGRRRQLCGDILLMLLSRSLQEQAMTEIAVQGAVDMVGATQLNSPLEVISALEETAGIHPHLVGGRNVDFTDQELARHSRYCAQALRRISRMPDAQLIFPTNREVDYLQGQDVRLTIVTARGLELPRKQERADWSASEARAVALWGLTAWMIEQQIFSAERNLPKIVLNDEVWKLSSNPIGISFFDQLAHDARKHFVRNVMIVHSIQEALRVKGLANLVDSYFIGRTKGREAQADALEALSVPRGVGHEDFLGEMHDGEFLARLDENPPDAVQVDQAAYPELSENQNTTPSEEKLRLRSVS